MEHKKVKTRFFTPLLKRKGQNYSFNLILCFCLLTLSGCITTEKTAPLAPSPPAINITNSSSQSQMLYQPYYFADPLRNENEAIKTTITTPVSPTKKKCRLKDKFDRKSVLAYEWGRNKISLDIDGINLKPSSTKAVRFEYKLRIQPEKTKKQLCRFPSNWQGLLGSGYNEIFIQKNTKLLGELTDIIKNITE